MEEALVSSKLDAIGQEYNLLLAGQLEEQRRWYDGRHAQVHMAALTPRAKSIQCQTLIVPESNLHAFQPA